jgi:hypothetical protein
MLRAPLGVPSPLVGEGQGGVEPRRFWNPPTPNPFPQGGGEYAAARVQR